MTRATIFAAILLASLTLRAEPRVLIEQNDNQHSASAFTLKKVPPPAPARAGEHFPVRVSILDGELDANGGGIEVLSDGLLPQDQDEPASNLFFRAGTAGGRLLFDLGTQTRVAQVNTYSWHPGTRGPQVYSLYTKDYSGDAVDLPKKDVDPATVGWKLLARVDTRTQSPTPGGQYGVHIDDPDGALATCRYLLFAISPTETADPFGNTFYSEIDLVDPSGTRINAVLPSSGCREILQAGQGRYRFTLDSCETPDLRDWSTSTLGPVVAEWYPKLVELLPSQGFVAPSNVVIRLSATLKGVAETSGTRITCAAGWFRGNLKGEAIGSVVHELVHVVQQYGEARRRVAGAARPPGWLVEGIADYLRWFLYEPGTHGADLTWLRQQRNPRLRYDAGYRLSANFLNWVGQNYDRDIVPQLNAALREGSYGDEIWKRRTGHSVQELGDEWKRGLEAQLAPAAPVPASPQL